ncbi:hypothetical protein HALLA_06960 [Halostagnicola larsenii XH-48]|uniref:Uncharacterized protein n=1 Tax=Halostagnicola larsenii XH-48 TaxID=797299 RepID=W0JN84_9EURY|nr:hypothetical protein [Halostagnicola larsenii]AHF98629.1 hypothetical protein HALLA_06960 [Halostagnicola larsenii XH-48]
MSRDETIDEEVARSDLVHERLRESPIKRWVVLDGNRYVLSAVFSTVVFLSCAAIGFAGYVPVTDSEAATTLVAAIVGGTLPFITIVLAINQLVLSQELGWPGDLRERFDAMVSFRREVETVTETTVSPAAPADFLQLIVASVVDHAETLESTADTIDDPELAALLERFADAVTAEGEIVTDALETANFGTFDALSSILGHFNGAHLYAARTIREEHGSDLPETGADALEILVELLGYLAVARQSFKTLYMQYELAHLSKLLLVVGFPTLLGGGIFLMTYGSIVDAVGNSAVLVIVVSTVVTVVFLPFIVLLVYTFRIASIASRTADFGPFVPRVDFEE